MKTRVSGQGKVVRVTHTACVGLVFLFTAIPGWGETPPTRDLMPGDVVAGWEMLRKRCHPEFCRYFFERDGDRVGVEVTAWREPEHHIVTQAVPGVTPVPPELLAGVEQWVAAYEERSDTHLVTRMSPEQPGEADLPGLPLGDYGRYSPFARLACVAVFLGLLALAVRARGRGAVKRPLNKQGLALGVAVAVSASVAIFYAANPAPLHMDTVRDLLVARDCLNGVECTYGVLTSCEGFYQGTAWVRYLALCLGLGMSIDQIQIGVLALQALSIAIVFAMAASVRSHSAGLVAAAICVLLARLSIEADALWNPSLLPLPVAAMHLALLYFMRTGRARFLLVSSMFTALIADSHATGIALIPSLILLGVLHGKRPLIGFLAACGFVLPHMALSPDSFTHNMRIVVSGLGWPLAAVGGSLGLALVMAARSRWKRLPFSLQLGLVWLLLAVPFVGGAVFLSGLNYKMIWRYYTPLLPAFAVGVAVIVDSVSGFLGRPKRQPYANCAIAVALLVVFIGGVADSRPTDGVEDWTMSESWSLGEHLFDGNEHGISDIVASIHGPKGWSLVRGVASVAPIRGEFAASPLAELTFVVRAHADQLPAVQPEELTVIEIGPETVAVLFSIEPFVRQEQRLTLCLNGFEAGNECNEVNRSTYRDPAFRGLYRYRAFLQVPGLQHLSREDTESFELRYSIAAREPGWRLVQTDSARPGSQTCRDECAHVITAVDGVEYRGTLPASSVWLFTSEPGEQGTLLMKVPFGRGCPVGEGLPEIYETRPGDQIWRDLTGLVTPQIEPEPGSSEPTGP